MHDERDRVHVGVGERRDDVRRAGTARHHRHAGPPGHLRVALGHVPGALLVAHEDVADRRVEDRVVDRQDRPAGQAEDDLDALVLEALYECLCSGQSHRCAPRLLRSGGLVRAPEPIRLSLPG